MKPREHYFLLTGALIASLLLSSCRTARMNEDPRTDYLFLKGHVKSVTLLNYICSPGCNADGDPASWTLRIKTGYRFDRKGNLLQERDYDTGNKIRPVTRLTNYIYPDLKHPATVLQRIYDVREQHTAADSSRTLSSDDSALINQHAAKYDKHGNVLENYRLLADHGFNPANRKTTYTYNACGQKTEQTEYNDDSTIIYNSKYHYNRRGRLTGMEMFSPSPGWNPLKITFTYDKCGRLTGDTSLFSSAKSRPRVNSYKFLQFDKRGNWTKRLDKMDNGIQGTVRAIEYY